MGCCDSGDGVGFGCSDVTTTQYVRLDVSVTDKLWISAVVVGCWGERSGVGYVLIYVSGRGVMLVSRSVRVSGMGCVRLVSADEPEPPDPWFGVYGTIGCL